MNTPVSDFLKKYAKSDFVRFHMPGHKGKSFVGCEAYDITEINGADVLYSCKGIIKESEDNLSSLFGTAHSFYSTEGSTLCIKAMLALVTKGKESPLVLAARNVHKAFCYAAALLDIDVEFIYSSSYHLCSCEITPEDVKNAIEKCEKKPCAFYLTSPDYLGYIADIKGISDICKEHGIPLVVDNAHGAYLKFLPGSQHPIDLGATLCCDSAHKTLPVLTGGAYMHISKDAPDVYLENARAMLSLFASTSPSYLIMRSLDLCNKYLSEGYKERAYELVLRLTDIRSKLSGMGYTVKKSEPFKIVIDIKDAPSLAIFLHKNRIEPEFYDSGTLVFMVSCENDRFDTDRLLEALCGFPGQRCESDKKVCLGFAAQRVMSIRSAMLAQSELLPVCNAVGRVSADPTVSCPPAVPIVVSGEMITKEAVDLFEKYGIDRVSVVK